MHSSRVLRVAGAAVVIVALPLAACSPTTGGGETNVSAYAPSDTQAERVFAKQTSSVSTKCFDPKLRQALAHLKTKFGVAPIVTSGHRSGGRKGSYHRKCMAADIQIPGASPKQVAAAARAYAGIGGVGTYCHTRSVHIDVGPERGWHWSC